MTTMTTFLACLLLLGCRDTVMGPPPPPPVAGTSGNQCTAIRAAYVQLLRSRDIVGTAGAFASNPTDLEAFRLRHWECFR